MPVRRQSDRAGLGPAALLGVLLAAFPAAADVVRLKVSGGTFGQGWMFLDQDGVCKVVTAGHVIRGIEGQVRQTLVLDGRGREWTTGAPVLNSTEPDIAVLPVPGAADPASCGDGRLSAIGVARRVANLADGIIRTTGESEVRDVPVSRRASVIDRRGGGLFAVKPKLQADEVRKGWSGSVVLDAEGPLGIVYEADETGGNEAYAVRVDVIRELMAAAPAGNSASPAKAPPRPALAVLAGSTLDPAAGPDQLLSSGGQPWQVRPKRRAVVFTVRFGRPVQIHQLQLASRETGPNRIEAIDVSTQAEGGASSWISANYCRAPAGAVRVSCRFLVRTVSSVRVLVKTRSDDVIGLQSLAVE